MDQPSLGLLHFLNLIRAEHELPKLDSLIVRRRLAHVIQDTLDPLHAIAERDRLLIYDPGFARVLDYPQLARQWIARGKLPERKP